ncbi:hypothetical protein ITJ57_19050 [Plantibacter sp. VKM Ac-2880]|uniref:hypothetical protein n=1 Tax=Plantibacter sp. VKM Ac-2880 TaxID=2783827 RepID=UPI001890475B|nr:hypothetical protein [Plantibacter sp. VKM Ac-2880]MBF4570871.1 hypothetical protein [Plantibacter sp. VKM Ac-2880]
MYRNASAAIATAFVALALAGCASTLAALDECKSAIAEHTGTMESNTAVTETTESPTGAYDWRGTYDGGEFACASPDGKLLTTALVSKPTASSRRSSFAPPEGPRDGAQNR